MHSGRGGSKCVRDGQPPWMKVSIQSEGHCKNWASVGSSSHHSWPQKFERVHDGEANLQNYGLD